MPDKPATRPTERILVYVRAWRRGKHWWMDQAAEAGAKLQQATIRETADSLRTMMLAYQKSVGCRHAQDFGDQLTDLAEAIENLLFGIEIDGKG